MKCPACHEEYDDKMEYCPFCGNDNPKVDPVGNDISHILTTSKVNNAQLETIKIKTKDEKTYNLEFDLNDEYEQSAYEELSKLKTKMVFRIIVWSSCILFWVLAAVCFSIIRFQEYNRTLHILIYVFIATSLFIAIGTNGKANKAASLYLEKKLEYAEYTLRKVGCIIKSVDKEKSTIIYEINNKTHRLSIEE